jgi:hypothetical protein
LPEPTLIESPQTLLASGIAASSESPSGSEPHENRDDTSARRVHFVDDPASPGANSSSARRVTFRDEPEKVYKYEKPASAKKVLRQKRKVRMGVAGDKPVTSRILKKVLNEKFYERPHLLAAQDVFAEYTVSWSDLFLDIIYVGIVYRLGDYLAHGLISRQAVSLGQREPLARTVFLFASLFYAIFSLWFTKLGFSSKCGITDVFHKFLDVGQALLLVVAAANITTPLEMEAHASTFPWVITVCLCVFHLTMMLLWFEVSIGKPSTTIEYACSRRNIRRAALAIASLICALLSIGFNGPLELTSAFWALSWMTPLLERLFTVNMVAPDQKAPYLLRYVLHRLGDGALILLGEGVFQIIRAVGAFGVIPFTVFTVSFLNVAAARIALFQMDCFDEHAKKHAVINSRLAHVSIQFVRSLASPAIVGVGVALKLVVGSTTVDGGMSGCVATSYYELLCVCSLFSLASFTCVYHLHRTVYFRKFRWRHFLVGMSLCSCFLIWPWLDCPHPLLVVGGCSGVWAVAIIFHAVTDDLFSSKDDQGMAVQPNAENDQEVARRATKFARKSMYKLGVSGMD